MSQGFYYTPPSTSNENSNSISSSLSSSASSQILQTSESSQLISVPTRPLQEFIYPETTDYYRDYSFVDRLSIIDPHVEDSLEKRKEQVLEHADNSSRYTKSQIYKQIATGTWRYRRVYGTESSSTDRSNPNVHNLIRVDKNKNVINEKYVDVIPDIASNLPRMQQITPVSSMTHYDSILKSTNYDTKDNTTIYFPLVSNRIYPETPFILEGGILYSGTTFDPTIDRELQVPKDYKIRERVIIEESLAELFVVNAVETYTEEEINEAYNKSVRDVYSYMSSWEKEKAIKTAGFYFDTLADKYNKMASTGPQLASTYIAGNYEYDYENQKFGYDGFDIQVIYLAGERV